MSYSARAKNLQQDKEFERLDRDIHRRNTHPPSMARDSKNNAGGKVPRSPTVLSSPTATRSRFSAVGGPVQPLLTSGGYASSEAGWSNVTGFRRQLDVADSPQSDYFNSGASKVDRRAVYIGRPLTESCLGTSNNAANQATKQPYHYDPEREDEDSSDDDDDTILPSDSASQASQRQRRQKPSGLFGEVEQICQHGQSYRPNPFGAQRSHAYSNAGGAAQRYTVEERKPRTS